MPEYFFDGPGAGGCGGNVCVGPGAGGCCFCDANEGGHSPFTQPSAAPVLSNKTALTVSVPDDVGDTSMVSVTELLEPGCWCVEYAAASIVVAAHRHAVDS